MIPITITYLLMFLMFLIFFILTTQLLGYSLHFPKLCGIPFAFTVFMFLMHRFNLVTGIMVLLLFPLLILMIATVLYFTGPKMNFLTILCATIISIVYLTMASGAALLPAVLFSKTISDLWLTIIGIAASIFTFISTLYLLKRTGIHKLFHRLLIDLKYRILMLLFSISLLGFMLASSIFLESADAVTSAALSSFVVILGILIALVISLSFRRKEEMHTNETQALLLLQQEEYIAKMEHIQKEMRVIQHDYKNMLSSLYLDASEGNLGRIQAFIENMMIEMNVNIGDSIKSMTQLGNLNILEIKSLVMQKMDIMQKKGITTQLEVLTPFDSIGMNTSDFVRCLGILLDNGIEATLESDFPAITIAFIADADVLTVLIKNHCQTPPDLKNMWSQGYSTKGKKRGLGLYTYGKIISRYDNALKETNFSNNSFTQVLKIQNYSEAKVS